MHPVCANSYPEGSRDEFERHNYTISYTAVDNCMALDCPLCFHEIQILNPPQIVILGLPLTDPQVVEANMRHRERRRKRAKQLQFIKTALQTIAVTNATFDVLDNIDEAEDKDLDTTYYYNHYHR
jgi:hypothetical protein